MDLRDRYERDGFLVLDRFLDLDTVAALLARARTLADQAPPDRRTLADDAHFLASGDQIRWFWDQGALDKIGHALHELDPVFAPFSRDPRIAALLTDLGCGGRAPIQSMVLLKPPATGAEVATHQDHTFLWTDPPSVVGLWFALEDATIENGCLWALPGGYREPPRQRFRRTEVEGTGFEVLDPRPLPTEGLVPLVAAAGACVVLHGLLPHRSGPNRSTCARTAFSLHLVDPEASYPADNWLRHRTT